MIPELLQAKRDKDYSHWLREEEDDNEDDEQQKTKKEEDESRRSRSADTPCVQRMQDNTCIQTSNS